MKLGGKYAKELGYSRFVGEEVKIINKDKNDKVEVQLKVKDVPFPVSLLVHPEDVTY